MQPNEFWWLTAVAFILGYAVLRAYKANTLPHEAYSGLAAVSIPAKGLRLLVVAPHPDDESLAAGGFLYRCGLAGASIRVILVSDGNRQGLRDRRHQEFCAATLKLGIPESGLSFWDYPDGNIKSAQTSIRLKLEETVQDFKPEWILYPHPRDRHADHSVLGLITEQVLAKLQPFPVAALAYLIHYRFYPQPRFLTRQNTLLPPRTLTRPGDFWIKIDLSPEAQQAKKSALAQYRSQLRNPFLWPLFFGLQRENELFVQRQPTP